MNLFTRLFLILFIIGIGPALVTGAWFLRSNARAEENARALHRMMNIMREMGASHA